MLKKAPRRLVVATANPGKLREFRSLLAGLPYELSSLAELGLESPAETGSSFLENATLKARHAATLSGFAAVADDSGIEVDALGGAPGTHSARYAGAGADDGANNAKLMTALRGVPGGQRRARYRCALVLVETLDAAPLTAEAAWEGGGSGGFCPDASAGTNRSTEHTVARADARRSATPRSQQLRAVCWIFMSCFPPRA